VICLEEAAQQIVKNQNDDGVRTKVRRMYDIISVFKALKLVEKTNLANGKPAFRWLGILEL
jgi:Fe2+ or Zn2+ uptake regulation protein